MSKSASRGRIPASEESLAKKANRRRGDLRSLQGELGEVAFMHKATSVGFSLALPYGHIHRYDFIVEGGTNLWRVQVKTSTYLRGGLYCVALKRRTRRGLLAYTPAEVDFIAAYIIPEQTWYIVPLREIADRPFMLFRPKGYPHRDIYAHYREAWHLLRQPDGLTFG
jgi:PD-(D/E)XK endonuclease